MMRRDIVGPVFLLIGKQYSITLAEKSNKNSGKEEFPAAHWIFSSGALNQENVTAPGLILIFLWWMPNNIFPHGDRSRAALHV
jgi:hypothetical protein